MVSPAPVSVCLIVKNEAAQIESCLRSIRPHVEEIVVVDTGSTDGTQDIARRIADKVETYTACNDSEGRIASFSKARSRSFELASCPWTMWIDGDDEVVGAEKIGSLIHSFSRFGNGKPVMAMFPYEYSHDHHGNITCFHYRERLVSPKSHFEWKGPVHEVLSPLDHDINVLKTDEIRIVHRRQKVGKEVEGDRNLRILKAHYAEHGESDVRQLYYLGLEYANCGDVGSSIRFHQRYVELSGWDDEKCLACLELARHYQVLGDYSSAIDWALKASTVRESWAEPYFSLSRSYYFLAQRGGPDERRNWERSAHFAKLGLSMPPTESILFVNPTERSYGIHVFLNMALSKIGDVRGAMESARIGLRSCPDDGNLTLNLSLYETHLAKQQIAESVQVLLRSGKLDEDASAIIGEVLEGRFVLKKVHDSSLKIPDPVDPAPPGPDLPPYEPTPAFAVARPASALPPSLSLLPGDRLDIAIYVGPGVEPWNPDTFARTGLGGSETMAWEMSRRLARLGNRVRLYGHCQGQEGAWDGVEFLHHDRFKSVSCDVLVTSRRPHAVDDSHGCSARVRLCWVHDVHCGPELTPVRGLRIDRFLVLSQWHRDFFLRHNPSIHPDQMVVTRNGIDLSRFSQDAGPRNPRRAVYSSSPDRGLDVALRAMPEVRKRVPDAELHIFYGFKNWQAAAGGDPGQVQLIQHLQGRLREPGKDGVHFHDRVDQATLAREFLKSGVWAYPTWFSETSCVTAMEAQAAGLRIVTSPIAALNETVGPRGTMVPGDWLSPEYMAMFVDGVVAAMVKEGDDDRRALQAHAAEHFDLGSLARDWDSILRSVLDEVERDVVPQYRPAAE